MSNTYSRPDFGEKKKLTQLKAIRAFCVDCYGGTRTGNDSPRNCPDYGCPLWRFRMGMGPAAARKRGYDVSDLS